MSKLLIKNAEIPGEQARVNLLIQDGIIESISNAKESQDQTDPNTKVIDASALLLLPGFTDLYTRLREPGLTRKGNIASETRAALAAGFTQVVCAPDTSPAIDTVATVEMIRQRAAVSQGASVLPMAALTIGLAGEQLAELATLQAAGCIVASQADVPIDNTNVVHSAMQYAASFDLPLFMTPRDAQLGAQGCAHAGAMATQLGLPEIPVAAETVALARLLELSRETGCRLHLSRVSSARAVNMIRQAKADGLPLSCDVGIHHLFYTDKDLAGFDTRYHSAVPFRSEHDRQALCDGLVDGAINAICSDHAPLDNDARLAPFPTSEPGLSAYDWFLPLLLQLPDKLPLSLQELIDKVTVAPTKILYGAASGQHQCERGAPANFSLIDPQAKPDTTHQPLSTGHNHPDADKGVAKTVRFVFKDKILYEL